jgi:hypothetical protein
LQTKSQPAYLNIAEVIAMVELNETAVRRLVERFGQERIVMALPQGDLRHALDLVTMQELADGLGLKYSTLRWHLRRGRIPLPDVRLVKRAYYTRAAADAIAQDWAMAKTKLGTN